MSQSFKLRYDQMRAGNPTASVTETGAPQEQPDGYAQKLSVVWPDGRRKFFKYAFLISGDFDPGKDTNEIILDFSKCQILLKGYSLEPLFLSLEDQRCEIIYITDARYAANAEGQESIVIEVVILKQE